MNNQATGFLFKGSSVMVVFNDKSKKLSSDAQPRMVQLLACTYSEAFGLTLSLNGTQTTISLKDVDMPDFARALDESLQANGIAILDLGDIALQSGYCTGEKLEPVVYSL